jgi:hypothetical protein
MVRDAAFSTSFGLLLLSNSMAFFHEEHYFNIHMALLLGAAVVLVSAAIHVSRCAYIFRSGKANRHVEKWHSAMIDSTYQNFFRLELYYHELIYMQQRILEMTPSSLRPSTARTKGGNRTVLSSVQADTRNNMTEPLLGA